MLNAYFAPLETDDSRKWILLLRRQFMFQSSKYNLGLTLLCENAFVMHKVFRAGYLSDFIYLSDTV